MPYGACNLYITSFQFLSKTHLAVGSDLMFVYTCFFLLSFDYSLVQ